MEHETKMSEHAKTKINYNDNNDNNNNNNNHINNNQINNNNHQNHSHEKFIVEMQLSKRDFVMFISFYVIFAFLLIILFLLCNRTFT